VTEGGEGESIMAGCHIWGGGVLGFCLQPTHLHKIPNEISQKIH